ncbi:hypothetical protein GCM10009826_22080 [Humibacillus xanthopallidus]
MGAAGGPGEGEQPRQPRHLTQLGLARGAGPQVLGEGAVVGVGQSSEQVAAEEDVQAIGLVGHLVTPISSRMARRWRTA